MQIKEEPGVKQWVTKLIMSSCFQSSKMCYYKCLYLEQMLLVHVQFSATFLYDHLFGVARCGVDTECGSLGIYVSAGAIVGHLGIRVSVLAIVGVSVCLCGACFTSMRVL